MSYDDVEIAAKQTTGIKIVIAAGVAFLLASCLVFVFNRYFTSSNTSSVRKKTKTQKASSGTGLQVETSDGLQNGVGTQGTLSPSQNNFITQ